MNTPVISVIVPVYNVEPYIRECIDSALSQTFSDFELILVNDGSTDDCGNILNEYAKHDSRILVIHQKNGGLSSARNAGLDAASGKYVYFLDGDDRMRPDLFSRMIAGIRSREETPGNYFSVLTSSSQRRCWHITKAAATVRFL